jgi:16S rRNA (cytosine967-C5)-methyltransferase
LRALVQLDKGRVQRLGEVLERTGLEGREQALCRELALGAERNRRLLEYVLAMLAHRGLPDDPLLRAALRLGAYQLLFLRAVPARAAVHETVALCTAHRRGFANALLRNLAGMVVERAADPQRPRTDLVLYPDRTLMLPEPGLPAAGAGSDPLALRHSLPDFLVARWRSRYGAAAAQLAAAASAVPELFLRATAVAADAIRLQARLLEEGVECAATEHALFLRWTGGAVPFQTGAFAEGWFVAQDPTAFAAAEAVGAGPGLTVVDLCAAPGTKTVLLAERVRQGGMVLAWDVDPARRRRIAENAARLKLEPWLRVLEDEAELRPGMADAVLADVPCSNTGVLARRVEVRRRLEPGTFMALAVQQRALLERALELCRPGGCVVYSTCSLEPEENEQVVAACAPGRAEVVRQELTLAEAGVCDGGYFAVLRRS